MKIKFKQYIKNLINFVIPLSFIKLIKKNLIKEKKKSVIRLDKNENIKLIKNLNNYIFEVHNSKLRYFGGLKFNKNSHPFLKYLLGNKSEMSKFYLDNQPNNIITSHGIKNDRGLFDKNFLLDPEGCLPWLKYNNINETMSEGELKQSEGRQQFGPVSEIKLNFEIKRLDDVEWVFYIVGGSHRVAALVALNFEYVPVILQPDYPSIVQDTEITDWPKIRENKITKSEAKKIFSSYF